jgi:thiol-disulfide isomerase/thioredoxin
MLKIKPLRQPLTALAIVVGIGNIGLPLHANPTLQIDRQQPIAPKPAVDNNPKTPTSTPKKLIATDKVETVSGKAEIEFAEYLAANDVKFYGAYWCSHCQEQKSLFGAVAASKLLYVECDKNGVNSQRQLCKDINIQMFPTWIINGRYFPGSKNLKELAELSGYQGATNFKYKKK